MSNLYFPNFSVKYPCFSLPFECKKEQCYYWESTIRKFGNCAIRVANEGRHKLEQLSDILGITRERVRQLEASALRHLAWIATNRGLTPQLREIVEKTFGQVCFWPLQPFDPNKYWKRETLTQLELIHLAFYLGVLNKFMKKEVPFLPVVECFTLGCITSSYVCLLCNERSLCEFTPVRNLNCSDYLTVSSFSELILTVKEKLGLISLTGGILSDGLEKRNSL